METFTNVLATLNALCIAVSVFALICGDERVSVLLFAVAGVSASIGIIALGIS